MPETKTEIVDITLIQLNEDIYPRAEIDAKLACRNISSQYGERHRVSSNSGAEGYVHPH